MGKSMVVGNGTKRTFMTPQEMREQERREAEEYERRYQRKMRMPVWALAGPGESTDKAEEAQRWLESLDPAALEDLAGLLRGCPITMDEPTATLDKKGRPLDPRLVLRCFFEDHGGELEWEPYLLLTRG
jgi:hypothetical protein